MKKMRRVTLAAPTGLSHKSLPTKLLRTQGAFLLGVKRFIDYIVKRQPAYFLLRRPGVIFFLAEDGRCTRLALVFAPRSLCRVVFVNFSVFRFVEAAFPIFCATALLLRTNFFPSRSAALNRLL
jgi:hypothetical protein